MAAKHMEAATMLLVNPILELQPKFSERDFDRLYVPETDMFKKYFMAHRCMVISMATGIWKMFRNSQSCRLISRSAL